MKRSILAALAAILAHVAAAASVAQPAEKLNVKLLQPQASGLSIVVIRDGRRDGERRIAVLNEVWFYCSKATKDLYAVPPGYETDFASIPGVAKSFLPPFGDWAEGAVIHDWLYDVAAEGGRKEADRIFREAMSDQDVGGLPKAIMYSAVRLFSGAAYRRARNGGPGYWKTHFVDRFGNPRTPPFDQPATGVWKRDYPCEQLDTQAGIDALRMAYEGEFGSATW